jgi:hypothetical protein
MNISTLFFYEELKALVGAPASQQWLKIELGVSSRSRTTTTKVQGKDSCRADSESRMGMRYRQCTAMHTSKSLADPKAVAQSDKLLATNFKHSEVKMRSCPESNPRTKYSAGENMDNMWMLFTDAAHLIDPNMDVLSDPISLVYNTQ